MVHHHSYYAPFAEALAQLGKAVLLLSPNGQVIFASPLIEEFLAPLSREDIMALDKNDVVCLLNDFEVPVAAEDLAAVNTVYGQPTEGLSRLVQFRVGTILLFQMGRLMNGEILVLIKDVTAYMTWLEQSKELTWQHRTILRAIEDTPVGILVYDTQAPGHPVIFANQACCQLLNLTRPRILGRMKNSLLPQLDNHVGLQRLTITQTSGQQRCYTVEHTVRDQLGLIFLTDITELVDQEDQLRHAQKLDSLGQLAGGVAHDFNNILSIITGYATMIEKWQGQVDERIHHSIKPILDACQRGAGLTDRLLAFARRKQAGSNDDVLLEDVFDHLHELLRPLWPPQVELKFISPPEKVRAHISLDHLSQILMNLLINARDASGDQGVITVQATYDQQAPLALRIDVTDQGCGIRAEDLPRIFEPFFTTKGLHNGTGLGLAVTYGLVKQNQGKIDVRSQWGVGTTFIIHLPADLEPVTSRASPRIQNQKDLFGKTVLLVEDEKDVRVPMQMWLEDMGCFVLSAADGNEALLVQDDYGQPIDILLSDIQMPHLAGDDLARLWRQIDPKTKIVLLSGYAAHQAQTGPHVDLFIPKPVTHDQLHTSLSQLVA